MEDAHTHLLAVPDDKQTAFFAVYDGHGGARVSQYAGINLHKKIVTHPAFSMSSFHSLERIRSWVCQ
jgi:protein phosphatase 2C family protein 2/3